MRIWLVNPFEPLAPEGFGLLRYRALARELAARGHRVTWWSSDFFHFHKARRPATPAATAADPFEVRLVPTPAYRGNRSPRRIWSHARLAAGTVAAMLREPRRPDLMLASLPPVELPAAVVTLGRRWGVPVVVDVTDTWPDAFGFVLPRPLSPALPLLVAPHRALVRRALEGCSGVSAVSRTFLDWARGYQRRAGVPAEVFHWAVPTPLPAPRRTTLEPPLRATFCGTFGLSYDFSLMLDAASKLQRSDPGRVAFSFIGTGPLMPSLRRRALPSNVTLTGSMVGPALDRALRQSHVGLCCYRRGSTQSLPIKPFLYLAYGLPVVNTLPGELAGLLRRQRLGQTVASADALADLLLELLAAPGRWQLLAAAALRHGQDHSLERVTARMADWLLDQRSAHG